MHYINRYHHMTSLFYLHLYNSYSYSILWKLEKLWVMFLILKFVDKKFTFDWRANNKVGLQLCSSNCYRSVNKLCENHYRFLEVTCVLASFTINIVGHKFDKQNLRASIIFKCMLNSADISILFTMLFLCRLCGHLKVQKKKLSI